MFVNVFHLVYCIFYTMHYVLERQAIHFFLQDFLDNLHRLKNPATN